MSTPSPYQDSALVGLIETDRGNAIKDAHHSAVHGGPYAPLEVAVFCTRALCNALTAASTRLCETLALVESGAWSPVISVKGPLEDLGLDE